jgi:hypothetical protein
MALAEGRRADELAEELEEERERLVRQSEDGRLWITIDRLYEPDAVASLVTGLEQTYDLLLAMRLARESGYEDLPVTLSHIRELAPENRLEISALEFASPGEVSLKGSGEVIGELRETLLSLATIDQQRKRNRLELRKLEQEITEREAALDRQQDVDEASREQQRQDHELELAARRQEILQTDLQLAAQYLDLGHRILEDRFGPDWRNMAGGQEAYEQMLAGGGRLLELMKSGVIVTTMRAELAETAGE